MLDKVIMLPFSMFIIFLFAFMGVMGVSMFGQWCMVQNESQFIASSMGKWGGYTQDANDALGEFATKINCPRGNINVTLSNTQPAPWGKPVFARLTVPFKFKVGSYNVGTYNLSGLGQSVSAYLPGAYSGVSYVSP